MTFFLTNQLFGIEFTASEAVFGIVFLVLGFAGLVKAIKEIRKDGWEPFRDRWIRPRQARQKKLDEVIEKIGSMDTKFGSMDTKIDEINRQFMTNGGSSLRDMVGSIDQKVEHLGARAKHQDETSSRAIFELNERGGLEVVNCAFRELVDADEKELLHRDYLSRIHPDDRTRLIHELSEAIDNKMPIDTTVRFRLSDKSFSTVRLLANPYVRSGGELRRFFGTAEAVN